MGGVIILKRNDFILMRHSYDDHSYIDGRNDTGLTLNGIEIAKSASKTILRKINSNKVIIRSSSKLRAIETAEIIGEFLLKNGIDCKYVTDNGLTELFQGEFSFNGMSHLQRINFLQSCWDDFEYNRMHGILDHRFAQNKDPEIVLSPGECHYEWSVRIANGVLNIIDDLNNSIQSINITHRGAIFEIQKIIEMVNGLISFEQVEKYNTMWMNYCQDYLLHIHNLDEAKVLTKKYICERERK